MTDPVSIHCVYFLRLLILLLYRCGSLLRFDSDSDSITPLHLHLLIHVIVSSFFFWIRRNRMRQHPIDSLTTFFSVSCSEIAYDENNISRIFFISILNLLKSLRNYQRCVCSDWAWVCLNFRNYLDCRGFLVESKRNWNIMNFSELRENVSGFLSGIHLVGLSAP